MMRIRRTSRTDSVDQFLDGGGDERYNQVAAVFAAATGPAQPGEIAGRQEALAGFLASRPHPANPPRRQSVIQSALLKLLTIKAAAVAVVAVGAGGVALAATNGTLPNPLINHPVPAASADRSHLRRPSGSWSGSPDGAEPSPSLVGLCHAYAAGAGAEHGKALESPAFQALITAAGGNEKVEGYCVRLLAASPAPSVGHNGARPDNDHSGGPSNGPSGGHPSGPVEHPSEHSSEGPSGRPNH